MVLSGLFHQHELQTQISERIHSTRILLQNIREQVLSLQVCRGHSPFNFHVPPPLNSCVRSMQGSLIWFKWGGGIIRQGLWMSQGHPTIASRLQVAAVNQEMALKLEPKVMQACSFLNNLNVKRYQNQHIIQIMWFWQGFFCSCFFHIFLCKHA